MVAASLSLAACAAAPLQDRLQLPPDAPSAGDRIAVVAVVPCASGLADPRTCTVEDPTRARASLDLPGIEGVGLLFQGTARGAHSATALAISEIDHAPLLAEAWTAPATRLLEENGYVPVAPDPSFVHTSVLPAGGKTAARPSPIPASYEGKIAPGKRLREPYHDFSAIAGASDAEHVLVLEVLRHGVDRWIGPFGIPSSAPYAVAAVRVSLEAPRVATETPEPLFTTYAQATREVADGDADAQRDALAAGVTAALREAIEQATDRLASALGAS